MRVKRKCPCKATVNISLAVSLYITDFPTLPYFCAAKEKERWLSQFQKKHKYRGRVKEPLQGCVGNVS